MKENLFYVKTISNQIQQHLRKNILNEKAFRDLGSGFGVRRIGTRDSIGIENKMFALQKSGIV